MLTKLAGCTGAKRTKLCKKSSRAKALLNMFLSVVLVVGLFPQASLASAGEAACASQQVASTQGQQSEAGEQAAAGAEGSEGAVDASSGDSTQATQSEQHLQAANTQAEDAGAEGVASEADTLQAQSVATSEQLPSFSAEALEPTDPDVAPLSLTGSGTEANPYIINSANDLREFVISVNSSDTDTSAYVRLAADIDLSSSESTATWEALGKSKAYPFKGTIDGGGHTISNLKFSDQTKSYQGFLGYAVGATVKNLTVSGAISAKDCTGGIAGYAEGCTFKNVVSNVTITNKGNSDTGGGNRVGGIIGESKNCTLTSCGNEGNVRTDSTAKGSTDGFGAVGGIIGYESESVTMKACYNKGSVTATSYLMRMGGLVGQIREAKCSFVDVYNTGEIIYGNDTVDGSVWVGGLLGQIKQSAANLEIKNALQAGTITIPSNSKYTIGNVIGIRGTGSKIDSSYTNIQNVYYKANENVKCAFGASSSTYAIVTPESWQATLAQESAMQASDFPAKLGNNFAADSTKAYNNGFPYLLWQNPNSKFEATISVALENEKNHEDANDFTLSVKDSNGTDVTNKFTADASNTSKVAKWVYSGLDNGATFTYTLSKKGYTDAQGTIKIDGGSETENVVLSPTPYTYTVNVSPANASFTFYVQGAERAPASSKVSDDGTKCTYTIEGLYNSDEVAYTSSAFGYVTQKNVGLTSVSYENAEVDVQLVADTTYKATLNVSLTSKATLSQVQAAKQLNAQDAQLYPEADTSKRPVVLIYNRTTGAEYENKLVYNSDTDGGVTGNEGDTNFSYKANLLTGSYEYVVRFDGYPTTTGTFNVESANVTQAVSLSPYAQDAWDGSYDVAWYLFHKDESTFTISSPAELAGLSQLVAGTAKDLDGTTTIAAQDFSGKTIKLGADLNMGGDLGKCFTPIGNIGSPAHAFAGTLDGCGHTIANLRIGNSSDTTRAHTQTTRSALFTRVYGTATARAALKNITFNNPTIEKDLKCTSDVGEAGTLVAQTEYVDIENIHVTGGSLNLSAVKFGGIVGELDQSSTMTGCSNSATVTSTGYHVGGVVGYVDNNSSVVRCSNTGNVTTNGTKWQNTEAYSAGGVAGFINRLASGMECCFNTGNISATNSTVGGVCGTIGYTSTTSVNSAKLKNCYNLGKVENACTSTTSSFRTAGGVAGYFQTCVTEKWTDNIVENCYNAGTVCRGEGANSSIYLGAVFGMVGSYSYLNPNIYLKNTWYDSTVAGDIKAVGYNQNDSKTNVDLEEAKTKGATTTEMKGAAFASKLGDEFEADITPALAGGYPILRWQDPNATFAARFNITLDNIVNDDFEVSETGEVTKTGTLPTIQVKDESDNVVACSEDVSISTDATGAYFFTGAYSLPNGTYTYTISKKGYSETYNEADGSYTSALTGTFVVNSGTVQIDNEMTATKYTFLLSVIDNNSNPIDDVNVVLKNGSESGEEITPINVSGSDYTFELYNGNYYAKIDKYGYSTRETPASDLINISYGDDALDVRLDQLSEHTLTVNASPQTGSFANGIAYLVLRGNNYENAIDGLANQAGTVNFTEELVDGIYEYEVRAGNFEKQTGKVSINGSNATLNLTLNPVQEWDGETVDTSWYIEDKNDLYISTAAELAGFAAIVNGSATTESGEVLQDTFSGKTVHLLSSISLGLKQWTPIGTSTSAFAGTFDGGSNRIENFFINPLSAPLQDGAVSIGLFGYVSTATISDVVVAGKIAGTSLAAVMTEASGLVGRVNANLVLKNCGNEVDIDLIASSIVHMGGLVGWASAPVAASSCYNKAGLKAETSKYGGMVGGIVGFISQNPTVNACYNTGNIELKAPNGATNCAVGGLLGSVNSVKPLQIKDSYVSGSITGKIGLDASSNVYAIMGNRSSSQTSDVIANTFWQQGSATAAVGNSYTGTLDAHVAADAAAMNSEDTVASLNKNAKSKYYNRNNQEGGTPLLVWERNIEKVELVQNPNKLAYNDQDRFDATGLKLQVTYSSGDPVVVQSGWTVKDGMSLRPGQQSVTVNYSGWEFVIPITVTQVEHESKQVIDLEIEGPEVGAEANTNVNITSRVDGEFSAKVEWTHAGKPFSGKFEAGSYYRANVEISTYYVDGDAWYVLPKYVQVNVNAAGSSHEPLEVLYATRSDDGKTYTLTCTYELTSCESSDVSSASTHLYYEGDENAPLYNSSLNQESALTLNVAGEAQTFTLAELEQAVIDSDCGVQETYSNIASTSSQAQGSSITNTQYTGLKLYEFLSSKMGAQASDDTEVEFASTNGTKYTTTLGLLRATQNTYSTSGEQTSSVPSILAFAENATPLLPASDVASMFTGPLMLVVGQPSQTLPGVAMNVASITINEVVSQKTQVVSFDVTCDAIKVDNPTITLTDSYGNTYTASNKRISLPVDEDFTYTVSANGYSTQKGTVSVSSSAVDVPVKLLKCYSGTQTQPNKAQDGYYEIYTPDELVWWAENGSRSDNVRLMKDVALNDGYAFDKDTSYSWPVENFGQKEENAFTGTFDGNGHTIYGFYIWRENTIDLWKFWDGSVGMTSDNVSQIGMFGYAYGATIKNLGVDGRIDVLDRPDGFYASWMEVGAIAGYAGSSTISNCKANIGINHVIASGGGSLVGVPFDGWPEKQDSHIGGIVGTASRCTVENCYSCGEFISTGCRSNNIGGVVGRAQSIASSSSTTSTVTNCYSTASIYSGPKKPTNFTSYQGGVVGTVGTSGAESILTGDVALNSTIDGGTPDVSVAARVCGDTNATVSSSYGLTDMSITNAIWDKNSAGNGQALSASAAFAKQTYTAAGWVENTSTQVSDTSTGWQFPSESYPRLYWEDVSEPVHFDQSANVVNGQTARNSKADETGFSEYAPPEHFTINVQVEGHEAFQGVQLTANQLHEMASTDVVKYSAYTQYSAYGRVTNEYIPVEDLLKSQGISFGEGDTFSMGGVNLDYENYFATPRYYYPNWATDPADTSESKQVPTALVMKSYGASGSINDEYLNMYATQTDYLYAYMTLFGQTKPSEANASNFIHQQREATVVYDAQATANEYLTNLLNGYLSKCLNDADSTVVGTEPETVQRGAQFVSAEQMQKLRDAIASGQATLASTTTNDAVMTALEKLYSARTSFDDSKRTGMMGVSFDNLNVSISFAKEYVSKVEAGEIALYENEADAKNGEVWAPTSLYNRLKQALIDTSNAVGDQYISQTVADELSQNLTDIVQLFEDNVKEKQGVKRVWGEQSYNTALEIANTAFTSTDTVVLARYNDFQDAMSATGLAGATNAAILLTEQDKLSDGVEAEIQSLGAKTVYIIGGEAAIKPEVQTKVGTIPGVSSVKRIFGNEAWDTSVECAKELKAVQKQSGTMPEKNYAAVAMSTNFQDALSLSSFAYKYQVPIFLETYDKQMPDNVKEMLTGSGDYATSDIYIPGGPGAVPFNTVEDALGQRTYVRMYGENGYDTSNEIAKYLVNNKLLSASYVCVASGAQVAKGTDALAGAALAGKNSGVMLLINDKESFEDVNTKTIDKFLTSNASSVGSTYVLGGTGVISDDTRNRISTILGGA